MLPPVSRTSSPADLGIGLFGSRNGSASALRRSQCVDGNHVSVDILHDVRIDFFLGFGPGDERGRIIGEDLETVLGLDDCICRSELIRAVESVLVPEQDVVIDDQRGSAQLVGDDPHLGTPRPQLSSADFLGSPLDMWKHHIA